MYRLLYSSIPPLYQQPYHPTAQDRLPTEAKQGWAWSVPEWETYWGKRLGYVRNPHSLMEGTEILEQNLTEALSQGRHGFTVRETLPWKNTHMGLPEGESGHTDT